MLATEYPKKRVIKYKFRKDGLVHLATVTDSLNGSGAINVSPPHRTICGKTTPIGHGVPVMLRGERACPECDAWAQPRGVLG